MKKVQEIIEKVLVPILMIGLMVYGLISISNR